MRRISKVNFQILKEFVVPVCKSGEVGLEINADKTNCMSISRR